MAVEEQGCWYWLRTSFLEPVKLSDSLENYPKGMRKMRGRLEKRETSFRRSEIRGGGYWM